MQIVPLAHHLHLAPTLARWHFDEWQSLYADWSYASALADLQSHNDPDGLPTTLVALTNDGELLGSVSLLHEDLPGFTQLSPWLASLFVREDCRGKGLGSRLLEAASAEARRLGVTRLFLFTPMHEAYYRVRSWTVMDRTRMNGCPVTILSTDLTPATIDVR